MSRSFWTIAQHISNIFASTDNRNICRGCRASDARARRLPQYLRPLSVCKPHSASTNSCFVAANIIHRTLSQRISQSNRPLHPLHARRQKPFSGLRISSITGFAHSLLLSPNDDHVEPLPSPDVPPTFWDFVLFLCASGLAPTFIALLALPAEDDSNDSGVLGEQQTHLVSYRRRFVGMGEKEREWSTHSHSSYYGYSPIQRRIMGSPAWATVTAKSSNHQRPVFPKRLFGAYLPRLERSSSS